MVEVVGLLQQGVGHLLREAELVLIDVVMEEEVRHLAGERHQQHPDRRGTPIGRAFRTKNSFRSRFGTSIGFPRAIWKRSAFAKMGQIWGTRGWVLPSLWDSGVTVKFSRH